MLSIQSLYKAQIDNTDQEVHETARNDKLPLIPINDRDEGAEDSPNSFIDHGQQSAIPVIPNSIQHLPPGNCSAEFKWAMIVSKKCYSDKQMLSGQDLKGQKKRYKSMYCLWCAYYNPDAPWAIARARKMERDTFLLHEKSARHIRAAALYMENNPMENNQASDLGMGVIENLASPPDTYLSSDRQTSSSDLLHPAVDDSLLLNWAALDVVPNPYSNISPYRTMQAGEESNSSNRKRNYDAT